MRERILVANGFGADGRAVTLARGRRYRLTDGREVVVAALQIAACKHGRPETTIRHRWSNGDGTVGEADLPALRFLERVAEELPE